VSPTRWPVDPFDVSVRPPGVPEVQPRPSPAGAIGGRGADGEGPDGSRPVRGLGPRGGDGAYRSELTTLARGGTLTLAGSIASSLLGFLLVVVITRGLHPARSAGVLFEAIALFMILSNTAELGADTGLVRMVSTYRATGRTQDIRRTLAVAIWPVLIIGGLAAAAVFVFAPQLSRVFIHGARREAAVDYIRLFAPFLPLATVTTVALSATRGFGTMVPYVAIQNVVVPGLRPLVIPLVLAAGLGVGAVALSWAIPVALGFVVTMVALVVLLRRAEHQDRASMGHRRSVRQLASEFWSFSAARGLAGFFMVAVIWLDILLVGALRSTREAGIYAAVSRFVGIGTFALQAVGIAVAPQIASLLARREHRRAEGVFQTGTWWLMVLGWPLYVTLAVFAPFLLRVFGRDYVAGQTALLILSLAMMTLVGTGNNKIVLLMGGGSGWNLAITAGSLALNVGLNLALIPTFGMNGAALAFAASIAFDMTATTLVVWRRMGLSPFGRGYPIVAIGSVLCFGVLGLAVRRVLGLTPKTFLAFAAVSSLLYLAWLWRFRRALRLTMLISSIRLRMRGSPDGALGAEAP
jgi:O-antigen/teichoic acid export membrane protein